jgi:hypothetical protein
MVHMQHELNRWGAAAAAHRTRIPGFKVLLGWPTYTSCLP